MMDATSPQSSTDDAWKIGDVLVKKLKAIRKLNEWSCVGHEGLKPDNISVNEWAYRCAVANLEKHPAGPLSALCLSGGGIRSAAFCLGIIQALANKKLLSKFDYLSTVSGGGYIGAWLSTLIKESDIDRAENTLKTEHPGDPLGRLRGFTNFLTPNSGLGSIDVWAGITLYLRNFLINWLVYLPLFFGLVLFAIFYRTAISELGMTIIGTILAFAIAATAMLFAVIRACIDVPSHRFRSPNGTEPANCVKYVSESQIRHNIVWPALIWSFLTPIVLIRAYLGEPTIFFNPPIYIFKYKLDQMSYVTLLATTYFLTSIFGYSIAAYRQRHDAGKFRLYYINSGWWLLASLSSFLFLCLGAWIGHICIKQEEAAQTLAIFAPGWLVLAHVLQTTIYVALRVEVLQADLDREWLAKLNALLLRFTLAWILFSYCCLALSEQLLLALTPSSAYWPLSISALLSGPAAAWISKTALAKATNELSSTDKTRLPINALLSILTIVFSIALFTAFGGLAQYVLGQAQIKISTSEETSIVFNLIQWIIGNTGGDAWIQNSKNKEVIENALDHYSYLSEDYIFLRGIESYSYNSFLNKASSAQKNFIWIIQNTHLTFYIQFIFATILFFMFLFFCKRVNANRFSLHAIYRNRLARAFIGTARKSDCRPEPFTGFDPEDTNQRLKDLKIGKLFPVINMTLNLTRQSQTAWAERKAASFFATPLACGSAALDGNVISDRDRRGFVPTSAYAGKENPNSKIGGGLTLAAAMAISGAALSPNWGYHSSPMTAFVMTLFNVRLGAWLPNPATVKSAADLSVAKPKNPFAALNGDLLGQTTDDSQAIYLSDGGHFENLGLYEMLRRRCKLILVVDATEDGQAKFEDLGNAIRKAYIDMQIVVNIDLPFSSARWGSDGCKNENLEPVFKPVVGCVEYPEGPLGIVIYIKPGWFENMPADIRAYGEKNLKFPHQSTANQWFGESQFESYRKLGFFQGEILTALAEEEGDLNQFFNNACLKTKTKVSSSPASV